MTNEQPLEVAAVHPVEPPLQMEKPFLADLLPSSGLVRAKEARETFRVDGTGVSVAVLDTGLRVTHSDFAGRVTVQRNFTGDNRGDSEDAADRHGHGTHVTGIIGAGGLHVGAAPGAGIVPLKVLGNDGCGSFSAIVQALQWVIDHREEHKISALCLAFGDGGNHQADDPFTNDPTASRIRRLAELGVVCCAAAGSGYFAHGSVQGMSFPAILRHALSVGAVYDDDEGGFVYRDGAEAFSSRPDRLTPFSQRLHEKVGGACATDIFAPGVPFASTGILDDGGESVQHGASHATPTITGIVLLIQSLHQRSTGRLPSLVNLRRWLQRGAVGVQDGDEEQDNVLHTGLAFHRVDAVAALRACAKDIAKAALAHGGFQRAVKAGTGGQCLIADSETNGRSRTLELDK